MNFLRAALNAQRKARGEQEFSTREFLKRDGWLNIAQDMLKRGFNVGFFGGERKRNQVLEMALFQPSLCVLDEIDASLDINALRIVANAINRLRSPGRRLARNASI